jgi:glycosyltransferase involved in cell wall biosynthesis
MGRYTVYVYAICKNEEKFVDRWVDSMSEADGIYVTDTGSTDGTVELLRKRGVHVFCEKVEPWRFDVARNLSLSHVPEDADICVCTDLDEVFLPGWREKLEKAWTPRTTQARYIYNWSLKEDGTPGVQMHYSKVHSRHDFVWRHPVHEWLYYTGREPEEKVFVEGMVLNHYPDRTKSRSSYLPLLEMAEKEEPESPRIAYYLGREYMYAQKWEKCIATLKRYLKLPEATWKEERAAAMRWIAASYAALGDNKQAYAWYFRAIAEAPHMRDAYIEFARLAFKVSDWPCMLHMVEAALKIKEKSKTFVNQGYAWDHTPYDLGALAAYYVGAKERALEHVRRAAELAPDDPRIKRNLEIIERAAKG